MPVTNAELIDWTENGEYLDWASEPEIHDSAGPHFGDVLTFVNPELNGSFKEGGTPHPLASAAVKELYGSTNEVQGWAVMVKVAEGTGEDSWYWWERYEGDTLADGIGDSTCTGCHSAGVDYVLTMFEPTDVLPSR